MQGEPDMEKTIYCLGDSNTFGYDPRSPWGEPYGRPWCSILAEGIPCRVCNDGINGRRILDVCRSYDFLAESIKKQQPDLLILLLGSNDILMEDLPDPGCIADRMEHLLQMLTEDFPHLRLFLLSPPGIRIPGPWRDAAAALSGYYESLAHRYGAGFLNLAGLPLSCDGVHLTEKGHDLLARMLLASLN